MKGPPGRRAFHQGFLWWRGEDLNLRPSGYEGAEDRPRRLPPSVRIRHFLTFTCAFANSKAVTSKNGIASEIPKLGKN